MHVTINDAAIFFVLTPFVFKSRIFEIDLKDPAKIFFNVTFT